MDGYMEDELMRFIRWSLGMLEARYVDGIWMDLMNLGGFQLWKELERYYCTFKNTN